MEGQAVQQDQPKVSDYRDVFGGFKYKSNKIKTSRYNIINFIPKSIFFQFMRIYNIYFLATVVLQGIPAVSTVPVYLAAIPFIFVIGISILRELIEDIKRKVQDRKINNNTTLVLKGNKFHEVKWANLHVGDIVYIHEGETFPADLVLLN